MHLQRIGKSEEAAKLLKKLEKTLDPELFSQAESLFRRISLVEELFGSSTKISNRTRKVLKSLDESIIRQLSGTSDEVVENIGAFLARHSDPNAAILGKNVESYLKGIVKAPKKGKLETIGTYVRGESLEIVSKRKLYGGNKIELRPDKTTTVTGVLSDVDSVARRGVIDEGLTGLTRQGKTLVELISSDLPNGKRSRKISRTCA